MKPQRIGRNVVLTNAILPNVSSHLEKSRPYLVCLRAIVPNAVACTIHVVVYCASHLTDMLQVVLMSADISIISYSMCSLAVQLQHFIMYATLHTQ